VHDSYGNQHNSPQPCSTEKHNCRENYRTRCKVITRASVRQILLHKMDQRMKACKKSNQPQAPCCANNLEERRELCDHVTRIIWEQKPICQTFKENQLTAITNQKHLKDLTWSEQLLTITPNSLMGKLFL
jgi:hypothetical protein